MTNRDIIKQLNSLKGIKPDRTWQTGNREILLKQIYGGHEQARENWIIKLLQQASQDTAKKISQPAMVTAMIAVFLVVSGALSIAAAKDTKPGDSLYIAKIVSEKTQLALAFDEKEKAKLGIEFASNRAREIGQVLAEEGNGGKEEKVVKLVSNFKKEIDTVKNRLEKISAQPAPAEEASDGSDSQEPAEEEGTLFSANANKDDNGLEISDQPAGGTAVRTDSAAETGAGAPPAATTTIAADAATTTEPDASDAEPAADPQIILNEAKELLDINDYDGTVAKLDEADAALAQVETGQVKGESETASSTEAAATEAASENTSEEMPDGEADSQTATGSQPAAE